MKRVIDTDRNVDVAMDISVALYAREHGCRRTWQSLYIWICVLVDMPGLILI
jgi:hypothetical protein